ncbi:MAG: hypothetical protein IPH09_17630 [bacterium]|nr:hypothetical protein [bacterium]
MTTHMSPAMVALVAFSLVFASLGCLAVLLFVLRALSVRSQKGATAAAPDGLDPDTLAVIAAAAYATLGAPIRIHRVHAHADEADESWGQAGRMDIMVSHQVGPK